jgi:hypothetical protein
MPPTPPEHQDRASIDLYWLPLGAVDASHCVRWNGRIYEALAARYERRDVRDLYHSALELHFGTDRFVIEMAPAWGKKQADRGVVSGGPVGLPVVRSLAVLPIRGPAVAERHHPGRVRSRGQPTALELGCRSRAASAGTGPRIPDRDLGPR